MDSQTDTQCDITIEEVMSANYRALQPLGKRVGVRANTREDVLRMALLDVAVPKAKLLQESIDSCPEGHFQSPWLSLNTILIAMVALICIFRFTNCFPILYSDIAELLAGCGILASVLALIFFCK